MKDLNQPKEKKRCSAWASWDLWCNPKALIQHKANVSNVSKVNLLNKLDNQNKNGNILHHETNQLRMEKLTVVYRKETLIFRCYLKTEKLH